MPKRYTHDPNAILAYGLDLEDWLDGDTISGATVADIQPAGSLTVSAPTFNATSVSYTVNNDGIVGTRYQVTIRVVTSGGSTQDFTDTFDIRNR